jgi:putative lipoic acid-binding regulatory protein
MSDQPEISFPLDWEFRIVTLTPQTGQAEAACLGILHRVDPKAAISRGLESRGGKYITLRAVCHIADRDVLKAVSDALVAVNGVKMLI